MWTSRLSARAGRTGRTTTISSFRTMPASAMRPDRKAVHVVAKLPDNSGVGHNVNDSNADTTCLLHRLPPEIASRDPDVLRAALMREAAERRRAECRADMQTEVVKLALDLLVREPDIEGFFGALTKVMVEESESHTCGVWLIDESGNRCDLWMAYVKDRLFTPRKDDWRAKAADSTKRFPCESLANHLFDYKPGWVSTIEYGGDDGRLPEPIRTFAHRMESATIVATPLLLGGRNLGWMTVSSPAGSEPETQWWRVTLIEAVARQAALALHHSRLVDEGRREERRKAILEERNRLARDIHDSLAQGFAAILMQLQAAQRAGGGRLPIGVSSNIEIALEIARTQLAEARRSVGALRPNVGPGEDLASALKRLSDMAQRTASVPIDLVVDELPRLGDTVEREIIGIAQEALTNAVRHSRARHITVRAVAVQSVGVRLSVADDGRGIGRDSGSTGGFGMTSMQERAERIGASLTIVTAPRNGTEVVLAWEPTALPVQVHVAS
jgi:signal transduction histidine kinase